MRARWRAVTTVSDLRGGGEDVRGGSAVGFYAATVRQQLAGVLENDHAVAEKAPSLLGVAGDDAGGVMIDRVGAWTGGLVLTHYGVSGGWSCLGHMTNPQRYS